MNSLSLINQGIQGCHTNYNAHLTTTTKIKKMISGQEFNCLRNLSTFQKVDKFQRDVVWYRSRAQAQFVNFPKVDKFQHDVFRYIRRRNLSATSSLRRRE